MVTTKLRPAIKFGPGYFIKEQMEYRHWTQEELAEIMGVTVKHINKILNDRQPISLDIAKILGEVFDTTPQYWLSLDANYRLWLESQQTEKEKQAELKANLYERMPIRDMIAKNWIPNFETVYDLHDSILGFLGVKNLDFEQWDSKTMPLLARKSESFNQYKASYTYTWYVKALQIASTISVEKYNKNKLEQLYSKINEYSVLENGINAFIKELENTGVVFFVLPHLQKTYLDGAAFFYKNTPVVVFTGRYKRIDNFWFTMAHEIAHVLYHLKDESNFFLDNFKESNIDDLEKEANEKASEVLKHFEIINFLKSKVNYLSVSDIENCAKAINIHPAIIIGKLAHDETISYANQRLFNENVLEIIDEKYLKIG